MIAVILNPILTCLRPSQPEMDISRLRLCAIQFFAIYVKTESYRTSKLPSIPIKSMIAVILNLILRCLRPSGAEIIISEGHEWAWPPGAFSSTVKFCLLAFFDYLHQNRPACKFIGVSSDLQINVHN